MANLKEFLSFEIDLSKSASEADALIRKYRELGVAIDLAKKEVVGLRDRQLELRRSLAKESDKGLLAVYRSELKEVTADLAVARERVSRLSKEQRELNASFKGVKPAVGTYAELQARLKALQFERINLAPIGSERFRGLTVEIADLDRQLKGFDGEVGVFARNVGNYRNEIVNAFRDLGFDDLAKERVSSLRVELKAARDEAIRLEKEYREAMSGVGGRSEADVKALGEELERAVLRANQLDRELDGIDGSALRGIRDQLREAFSVRGLLSQGVGIAVGSLAVDSLLQGAGRALDYLRELSKVEGQIARLNDKLTDSDVKAVIDDLRTLDTATGLTDLGQIAALSGQFGVARKDIKGFVSAVDAVNVALGDEFGNSVDEVTKQVGKLAVLYGNATKSIGRNTTEVGSLLNEVSAKLDNVTAAFQADFGLRLSSTAKKFGLSLGEVAGIGALLEQSGLRAESASTAVAKTFSNLVVNASLYSKELGLSNDETKEFARLLDSDVNKALLFFLGKLDLANKGNVERAAIMKRLKITDKEESDVLVALATNLDKVRRNQTLATNAMRDGSSIGKEYSKSLDTLDGLLSRIKNRLVNVFADPDIVAGLENLANGVLYFIDELGYMYNKVAGVFQSIKDGFKSVDDFLRKSGTSKRSILPDDILAPDDEQVKNNAERAQKTYSKFFGKIKEESKKTGDDVRANATASFKGAQDDLEGLLFGNGLLGSRGSGRSRPRGAETATDGSIDKKNSAVVSSEERLLREIERLREKEVRNEKARNDRRTEQAAERNAKRIELELATEDRLSAARADYQTAVLDSERRFGDALIELANERDGSLSDNQVEAEQRLAELREQLRERVLSQEQYNLLAGKVDEEKRLRDLSAEAIYQKSLLGLEEEKRERVLASRESLQQALEDVRGGAVDLLPDEQRLRIELSLVDDDFEARVSIAKERLLDLEAKAALNPTDEGLLNEIRSAVAAIDALDLERRGRKSGILTELLTKGLSEAEDDLLARFSIAADELKSRYSDLLANVGSGASGDSERSRLGVAERSDELVLETARLESQKALYLSYLADIDRATDLSAKDRAAIEKTLGDKIREIDSALVANERSLQEQRVAITAEGARRREEIEGAVRSSIGQIVQAGLQLESATIDAAYSSRQANLESMKERELAIYGTTEAGRSAIEEEYRAKSAAAEKAYREERKSAAVKQAIINGVLAATEIIATHAANPILMGILLASTAILTGFQVATIQRQKFGRGGLVGGERHVDGGTLVEAERGEGFVSRGGMGVFGQLVSAANEAGGGVRFDGYRGLTKVGRSWLSVADWALRQPVVPDFGSGALAAASLVVHHFLPAATVGGGGSTDLSMVHGLLDDNRKEIKGLRDDFVGFKKVVHRILVMEGR